MFEPDTDLDEILVNLRFMERHIENPFNFCRAEAYPGTGLETKLARGTAAGRRIRLRLPAEGSARPRRSTRSPTTPSSTQFQRLRPALLQHASRFLLPAPAAIPPELLTRRCGRRSATSSSRPTSTPTSSCARSTISLLRTIQGMKSQSADLPANYVCALIAGAERCSCAVNAY